LGKLNEVSGSRGFSCIEIGIRTRLYSSIALRRQLTLIGDTATSSKQNIAKLQDWETLSIRSEERIGC